MGSVRGIILDVDGTLVDSNDAHARAWVEALAEHGFEVPFARIRRLIGMGGDKLLPEAAGIEEASPQGRKISKRRQELFRAELPSLRAFPGVKDLLLRMRQQGLALVVASSAKKDELGALLKLCGADEVIEDKTSSDDAERSKPDPDIIQAALENLDLPPEVVLMLGDTPYDIEAARRAAIKVIAFRCGGWQDTDLAGALAIYDDPADLLAHFESSPIAATADIRRSKRQPLRASVKAPEAAVALVSSEQSSLADQFPGLGRVLPTELSARSVVLQAARFA
jgi:HAD superfamily hydrolase (TIGR01549 family)